MAHLQIVDRGGAKQRLPQHNQVACRYTSCLWTCPRALASWKYSYFGKFYKFLLRCADILHDERILDMVVSGKVSQLWWVPEEKVLAYLSWALACRSGGVGCVAGTLSRTYQLAAIWIVCHHPEYDIPVLDSWLPERIRMQLSEWFAVDDMRFDSVLSLRILFLQVVAWKKIVGMGSGYSRKPWIEPGDTCYKKFSSWDCR